MTVVTVAELRNLKGHPTTNRASVPSAVVRQWAHANGIECPDRGRIPTPVQAKYDAAHQGQS